MSLSDDPLYTSLFFGNSLNWFSFGVLTLQLYLYYPAFPNDRWLYKAVVYVVYILELFHVIFFSLFMALWYPIQESIERWIAMVGLPLIVAIVALMTQSLYAHRIRVITGSKFISCGIMALLASQVVAISILMAFEYENTFLIVIVWTAFSVVCDLLIATTMVWGLLKGKVYSRRLKFRVTRIVYIVIGSGVLIAVVNIITLILAATKPYISFASGVILSKLYANSMMVVLNNRTTTVDTLANDQTVELTTIVYGTTGGMTTETEQLDHESDDGQQSVKDDCTHSTDVLTAVVKDRKPNL